MKLISMTINLNSSMHALNCIFRPQLWILLFPLPTEVIRYYSKALPIVGSAFNAYKIIIGLKPLEQGF